MRSRIVPLPGWVECGVGALFSIVSLVGWSQGFVPGWVAVWNLLALSILIATARWAIGGLWLMVGLVAAGLLVDPGGAGMTYYIGACAVAMGVRLGRFRSAAVATAVMGAALTITMQRRAGEPEYFVGNLFAATVVYLIAWGVGIGFRAFARAQATEAVSDLRGQQLAMANDIHDFVARNLSGLVLLIETAKETDSVTAELMEDVLGRVRLANNSLRGITEVLRDFDVGPPVFVSATDALEQGKAELAAVGMPVKVIADQPDAFDGLPEKVNLAVGRILAEALHNALLHGDRYRPCLVSVQATTETLDLMISNYVDNAVVQSGSRSIGLRGMQQHAQDVGGVAESHRLGERWVCAVTLPLRAEVPL